MNQRTVSLGNVMASALALMLICASAVVESSDYDTGAKAHKSGDFKQAMAIWKPLAAKGDTRAQYSIGRLYEKGHGVDSDLNEALVWYRKSADGGYADAQYRVAVAYVYGVGGYRRDHKAAIQWLSRAGENGHRKSQKFLVRIYETGELGVTPDEKKASYWSEKLAGKP